MKESIDPIVLERARLLRAVKAARAYLDKARPIFGPFLEEVELEKAMAAVGVVSDCDGAMFWCMGCSWSWGRDVPPGHDPECPVGRNAGTR